MHQEKTSHLNTRHNVLSLDLAPLPVIHRGLHFDLNYTLVKFHDCVFCGNDAIKPRNLTPDRQTDQ